MKRFTQFGYRVLIALIVLFIMYCTKEVDFDSLVERQGVKYEVNSEKGYTGEAVGFHENGQKSIQCEYAEGKLHGEYFEWYDNGQLKTQCNYSDGSLLDSLIQYYQSGEIQKKCYYVEGKLDGLYLEYYESGKLLRKGLYQNGLEEGLFVLTDSTGLITIERNYLNGLQHGTTKLFWANDSLRALKTFSHGKKVGKHTFFDSLGNLMSDEVFDSLGNKTVENFYSIENGKSRVATSLSFISGKLFRTSMYSDGKLMATIDDSTELGVDYKRTKLYMDGVVFIDEVSRGGYVEKYWNWEGGGLAKRYQVAEDGITKHGEYLEYKEDGYLWISGQYRNGKQSGLWKWYDKYGNVTNREYH